MLGSSVAGMHCGCSGWAETGMVCSGKGARGETGVCAWVCVCVLVGWGACDGDQVRHMSGNERKQPSPLTQAPAAE